MSNMTTTTTTPTASATPPPAPARQNWYFQIPSTFWTHLGDYILLLGQHFFKGLEWIFMVILIITAAAAALAILVGLGAGGWAGVRALWARRERFGPREEMAELRDPAAAAEDGGEGVVVLEEVVEEGHRVGGKWEREA